MYVSLFITSLVIYQLQLICETTFIFEDKLNDGSDDLPLSCRRDGRPGRQYGANSRPECWECQPLSLPSEDRACADSSSSFRTWSAAEERWQLFPSALETASAVMSSASTPHLGCPSERLAGPDFCWGPTEATETLVGREEFCRRQTNIQFNYLQVSVLCRQANFLYASQTFI